MAYAILADAVVLIHFVWILFLITGAYWARKRPWLMVVHVAGLVFAVTIQVFGWYCPLTYLEIWLREGQGRGHSYPGSFIAHYLQKLVYLELSRDIVFIMTLVLFAANVGIYVRAFRKAA